MQSADIADDMVCRMAPEVIACDENPDSTYDCKVSCDDVADCTHATLTVAHS